MNRPGLQAYKTRFDHFEQKVQAARRASLPVVVEKLPLELPDIWPDVVKEREETTNKWLKHHFEKFHSGLEFSTKSEELGQYAHPDLLQGLSLALGLMDPEKFDMGLRSSGRTVGEQADNVINGASRTYNSNHLLYNFAELGTFSAAIDFHLYQAYQDGEQTKYRSTSKAGHYEHCYYNYIKPAFDALGIAHEWGGSFQGFFDGYHIQLNENRYRRHLPNVTQGEIDQLPDLAMAIEDAEARKLARPNEITA